MSPSRPETNPPAETEALFANEDEEYASSEDSDFDIDAAPAEAGAAEASSDSEPDDDVAVEGEVDGEASQRAKKRRKVSNAATGGDNEDVVIAELDSGDEVTIRRGKEKRDRGKKIKGKKRKGKQAKKGEEDGDDDDERDDDFDDEDGDAGGEGGFVRTRGMRMKMQEERKPLARADDSTVNVDALWARMNTSASDTRTTDDNKNTKEPTDEEGRGRDHDNDIVMADGGGDEGNAGPKIPVSSSTQVRQGEETITIKRKYNFAGDIVTEERVVPKDSAEAKLHLSMGTTGAENESEPSKPETQIINLRRPLRKMSRFDPNPPGLIKRSWEKHTPTPVAAPGPGEGSSAASKGTKLNVVEKSKLDWAAYVDRTGIKDDLDVHSRAKEGYLGRMEFLNRIDNKKEEERRNARLKNIG